MTGPREDPGTRRLRGLEGKVALVTGAAGGIGAAVARRLAAEGCRVVLSDFSVSGAAAVAETLPADSVAVSTGDIAEEDTAARAVDLAVDRFGALDLVHNNAAVLGPGRPIADTSLAEYSRLFDINVTGAFLVLRAALRRLATQGGGGAIVNTASTAVRAGSRPGAGLYGTTKYAVVGMTRAAALEGAAYGVRVNALAPGAVDTDMLRSTFARLPDDEGRALEEAWIRKVPVRRLGRPEDMANVVAWLLSAESSYLTGTLYVADGGGSA